MAPPPRPRADHPDETQAATPEAKRGPNRRISLSRGVLQGFKKSFTKGGPTKGGGGGTDGSTSSVGRFSVGSRSMDSLSMDNLDAAVPSPPSLGSPRQAPPRMTGTQSDFVRRESLKAFLATGPVAEEEEERGENSPASMSEENGSKDDGADEEMSARVARAAGRLQQASQGPDPDFLALLASPSVVPPATSESPPSHAPRPKMTGQMHRATLQEGGPRSPVRRATTTSAHSPNLTPSFAPATAPPAPPASPASPAANRTAKKKAKKGKVTFAHKKGLVTAHLPILLLEDFVDDYFFNRVELKAMGQNRFDDASVLRTQRRTDEETAFATAIDDLAVSGRTKARNVKALLMSALERDNRDVHAISIRGIEHFVYPELQREMIRRKKLQKGKVLEFARSKQRDPQGWRLAEHSRSFSAWARAIASEKAMKYCVNGAGLEADVMGLLGADDQQSVQKGMANMDMSYRPLRRKTKRKGRSRGYSSGATSIMSADLHIETHSPNSSLVLKGIAEDEPQEGEGGETKEAN